MFMQEANHSSRLSRRRRSAQRALPPQPSRSAADAQPLKLEPSARRERTTVQPIASRPTAIAPRTRHALRPAEPLPLRLRKTERPAQPSSPRPDDRRSRPRRLRSQSLSEPSVTPSESPRKQRRARRKASPLVYLTRLMILGIGVGAIAGTVISVLDPALRQDITQAARSATLSSSTSSGDQPARVVMSPVAVVTGQPMTDLTNSIESLTSGYTSLTPGVFVINTATGEYLDLHGTSIFASASMIKVPVLIALLQEVDAGKVRLDESLTMKAVDVATGSGEMQYQAPGTRYTVLETASKMITISDNTATNMLIARLGGVEVLNQRFRQWGLTSTTLRNLLPDLTGTNTTTPKELAELLARVTQGDLLSMQSRDRLFAIMQKTETDTLLPAGLGEGATIAHKTGDIASMVGDVGLIDTPKGDRYIATIMVQRPPNDPRAQELIRRISKATYDFIIKPQTQAVESEPVEAGTTTDNSLDIAPASTSGQETEASTPLIR